MLYIICISSIIIIINIIIHYIMLLVMEKRKVYSIILVYYDSSWREVLIFIPGHLDNPRAPDSGPCLSHLDYVYFVIS